jgi:hypothetical protein
MKLRSKHSKEKVLGNADRAKELQGLTFAQDVQLLKVQLELQNSKRLIEALRVANFSISSELNKLSDAPVPEFRSVGTQTVNYVACQTDRSGKTVFEAIEDAHRDFWKSVGHIKEQCVSNLSSKRLKPTKSFGTFVWHLKPKTNLFRRPNFRDSIKSVGSDTHEADVAQHPIDVEEQASTEKSVVQEDVIPLASLDINECPPSESNNEALSVSKETRGPQIQIAHTYESFDALFETPSSGCDQTSAIQSDNSITSDTNNTAKKQLADVIDTTIFPPKTETSDPQLQNTMSLSKVVAFQKEMIKRTPQQWLEGSRAQFAESVGRNIVVGGFSTRPSAANGVNQFAPQQYNSKLTLTFKAVNHFEG